MLPQEIERTIIATNLRRPRITRYVRRSHLPMLPVRQDVNRAIRESRNNPVFRDLRVVKPYRIPIALFMEFSRRGIFEILDAFLRDNTEESYVLLGTGPQFVNLDNELFSVVIGKEARTRGFLSVYKLGGSYQGTLWFRS